MSLSPIVLFTDYGWGGPYVGLLHAVVRRDLPDSSVIDLQHDLPPFRPRGAGILLAAQLQWLPTGSVVVAVVDPGVGTARNGLVIECRGHLLVGPDNGLFGPLLSDTNRAWEIEWRPEVMSATFHGRDWFAPVAVRLAGGNYEGLVEVAPSRCIGFDAPNRLDEVVYVDTFGNCITGVPGDRLGDRQMLNLGGQAIAHANTFGEVEPGRAFWHVNSLGLVELAVNQGGAADLLGLAVGDPVPLG